LQIGKDTVVALTYRLSTLDGELLEEAVADSPAVYLQGGYDGIFPRVEAALEGKAVGAELDLVLEPDDAFGEYDESLKRTEPRTAFPQNVEVGMRFEGTGEDSGETRVYTVTSVDDERVEVDGNHPYAGKSLDFHCTVKSVRRATREEITHGHVHGPGGHHH